MTRNQQKTILYPERYGSGSSPIGESVADAAKIRSMYTNTYSIMYGSKTNFTLKHSRVKKGSGKGKLRMQNVTIKSENTVDNLTWCV